MIPRRRKGIAIVDTPKGIVLVAQKSKIFMFPGGGAERWETRKKAAIRELYEETGLKTKRIKYLFSYIGGIWKPRSGKAARNHIKVFLIDAIGVPKPRSEILYIGFWKPKSKMKLTKTTTGIIEKYLKIKSKNSIGS